MKSLRTILAVSMVAGSVTAAAAQSGDPGRPKPGGGTYDNNLPAKPNDATKAGVGSRPFGSENLPAKPDGTQPGTPSMGTSSPDLPAKPGDQPKTPK
jgi:hypothetical protein